MADEPTIECTANGPLLVKGLKTLVDLGDRGEYETREVMALCRCGGSANKPFCDGTHAKNGFTDEKSSERTADRRDDYAGREITIHDNRGICAHAGYCTDRLSAVFRLRQEPWIDPDGAAVGEIVAAVEACPSGALSYSLGGTEHRDREGGPRVLVAPKGPYAVKGGVELGDVERAEGASREHFCLCRCGQSRNKPFCDGSHWSTSFDDRGEEA